MNDDIEIIEDEFIIDNEPDYDAIYDEQRLQELDELEKSLNWTLTKIETNTIVNARGSVDNSKTYHYTSGDYEKTITYDTDGNLKCSTFGHKPITIKKEI